MQATKRILVTGGAGFLGSHLVDRLLLDPRNYIIIVDNFSTGSPENIQHVRNHYKVEIIRHDITFPLYLEVDEIYNLACAASPIHYQRDPVQTTKTCVHGAINMLGLAKRCGARILQASTSEVYGNPQEHPQTEEYWGNVNPIGPRACYDEAKRCAETLFYDYKRQHDLEVRVARIFNTYGPRMAMHDGRVVSNFIVSALRGSELTVYGDGLQTRSLCFVGELIDGLVKLMASNNTWPGPVNLGNPDEVSILSLAEQIIKLTDSKSRIVFRRLPQDDPERRSPDITLAMKVLNWKPTVARAQGLAYTIDYFRMLLADNDVAAEF